MTLDDLRAAGLSDADIAELLAFNPSSMTLGGGQDDAARALAAAQATGLSNLGYVPVYGGGDIIAGTTQGILSRLGIENPYAPIFQTLGSENSGAAMDATERTTFAPTPGQTYRLVDNLTGETFGEASDPAGISALVNEANALSAEQGKKANWDLQQSTLYSADPNKPLAQGWSTIAQDDPNTIPMSIKAMMAAMAVMTGAGVAQQINAAGAAAAGAGGSAVPAALPAVAEVGSLAPGALASLPANLAAVNAGAQAALASAGLAGAGAGAAGGGLLSSAAAPSAATTAITEGAPIFVTAGGSNFTLPSIAALTAGTGAAATGLSSAGPSTTSNLKTDEFGNTVDETGAIVATAGGGYGGANLGLLLGGAGLLGGAALLGGGSAVAGAGGGTASGGGTGAGTGGGTTGGGTTGAAGGGVLGTGLSAAELATLASLGVSGLSSLLGGGGGGTGATAPYVSPFGAGTGFGTGMDYRAQPNILDYERYGFGPEATFFRPEYNRLVSGASAAPAASTTPTYQPLI
jgi:hypothetical protein